MDAGGLALCDDFVSLDECSRLPLKGLVRQIEIREKALDEARYILRSRQIMRDLVILRDMKARATRLSLSLDHGYFVILSDHDRIQTCYTDRTDTSRSSSCSVEEIVRFAREVLELFDTPADTYAPKSP